MRRAAGMVIADGDDFTGYVGARWPALVRTAVLLGCPPDLAPEVVTAALARCRRGWRDTVEHDDPEVVVHGALLAAWDELRREPWWEGLRPRTDDEWPLPDLADLDRMPPTVRAGVVLRRYAALDPAQAAAVAGPDAGGPLPVHPDTAAIVARAETVVVYAPPPDQQIIDAVTVRRRSRALPVVAVVVIALLLAGGTWWAQRDRSADGADASLFPAVEPNRGPNPAEVAWYADDVLHLTTATYVVPDLVQFRPFGAGAVYGDRNGNVVHLTDDGTRTLLGTKDAASPLIVSDENGRAAWVTGASGERPRLVVHDVVRDEPVGSLDLEPGSGDGRDDAPGSEPRAVAFDAERVYFTGPRGWGAWTSSTPDTAVESGPEELLDVASRNRLFQVDERSVRIEQPFFNVRFVVPGRGGRFSPDGNYVVTRSPDDGSLLVYDSRSGDPVEILPPPGTVDAVLEPDLSITYLAFDADAFEQPAGSDSEPSGATLLTCRVDRLNRGECGEPLSFLVDRVPVLPG